MAARRFRGEEITAHLDEVETDSSRSLETLDEITRRAVGVIEAVGVSLPSPAVRLGDLGFPAAARAIAERFVGAAHLVKDEEGSMVRAFGRVGRRAAPATRSKQSAKDCLIVETYLHVARELRASGFAEAIVLLTTNTADFTAGSRSQLHADLASDFDSVGMTLATDFLMARYVW